MWRTWSMIATLLPMLFHSVFGCCWHHAHCFGQESPESVAVESKCGHHHATRSSCPHYGALNQLALESPTDSSLANDAESPCNDGRPCEEDRCVFLPCDTVKQDFDIEACSLVLGVDFRQSRIPGLSFEVLRFPAPPDRLTSTVSSRAMIQVWVV